MKPSLISLCATALASLAIIPASGQVVEKATITKGSSWIQTSAADPVINPRNPGPGYGGPYNFLIDIDGTNLASIAAPVVTLPPGSLYPTQSPARHNNGILTYRSGGGSWAYGSDGNNWGGTTENERDTSFGFGSYGMNLLGESFALNFPNTTFPANTPKAFLSGGTWSGGKYLIDVTQPLTITTNTFTHFDKNADAAISFWIDGPDGSAPPAERTVFYSENTSGPNFLSYTVPANTLVAGKDYFAGMSFYAITDKRGSFSTRLDAAAYERFTEFKIAAIAPPPPGASATLYGTGDLGGSTRLSEVRDATKSGGVIYAIGDSIGNNGSTGADTAFVWSSTGGLVPLPDIVTNFSSSASIQPKAITPDANYIASQARVGSNGAQRHAVRVTRNGLTNLDLSTAADNSFSQASTISNDGSIVYGTSNKGSAQVYAARFTASGPTLSKIPFLNAGDDSSVPADRGASANGSVMVGRSTNVAIDNGPTSPGGSGIGLGNRAFRYVQGTGVSAIPLPSGGTWSGAIAVSPNGNLTLVRGDSSSAPKGEMYVHNATTGLLTSYGTPNGSRIPGGISGVTADGTIVASSFNASDNPTNATVIRNAHGWHDFQSIVERAGVDLTGWNLRTETLFGLSPDGTLVWGRGRHDGNREGFVVEFPAGYLASVTEPAVYSTPGADIVGAWTAGDTTTTSSVVLIFFSNGYYIHMQFGESTGNVTGFERGQYTWNAATGAFTCTTLVDTNGDIGLSGMDGIAGITMTISGDTITGTVPPPNGDSFVLNRVVSSGSISGAWGDATASDNSVALLLLPNGRFFFVQDGDSTPAGDPNGHDGIEWGTYSWNSATGAFTATVLADTNGEWGLSHPEGPQTLTLSTDLLTLNYGVASFSFPLPRVGAAAASISLQNVAQIYDGSPKAVTPVTTPFGISTAITYNGTSVPPTNVGSYAVVATISDSHYKGSATGTLTIAQGTAFVNISNTNQVFDGSPKSVTISTTPSLLATTVTYDGSLTPPTSAGTYAVVATIDDSNHVGSTTGTLTITKAAATIALGDLTQAYDGTPRPVSATTVPAGLGVDFLYDGQANPPVAIGSHAITATVNDLNYAGSTGGTLTITNAAPGGSPAGLNVLVTPPAVDGNGDPVANAPAVSLSFDQITTPGFTSVTVGNTGPTPPGNFVLGTPPVYLDIHTTATFTGMVEIAVDYSTLTFAGDPSTLILGHFVNGAWVDITTTNDTVNRVIRGETDSFSPFAILEPVSVTLGGLSQTYDGSPKSATATTIPSGLAVAFTYDGTSTPPVNAGDYSVVATIADGIHLGSASGTLHIAKATATLSITDTAQVFDGTPRPVTVVSTPAGLSASITYDGGATAPSAVGSYSVDATVTNSNYNPATTTSTLVIAKAVASITLSNLAQIYDGTPKSVSTSTTPAGLVVNVTYDGSASAPTATGSYAVNATVSDASYSGSTTGTLVIALAPLQIGSQPANTTVTAGNTAVFSVTATGTGPITYQWRKGSTNIVGATSSTLSIPNTQSSDAGSYRVVVTNPSGSLNSTTATLTVQLPPTITAEPQNLTRTAGQSASFSVTATGTAILTYQWRFNGADIAGAMSRTLSLAGIAPVNEGTYSVVVTNPAGSATSADASLTVLVKPVITQQPLPATVILNGTASFSVSASGTAPLTYQWRRNSVALAGETSPVLNLSNIQTAQAGSYSVVVTNTAGSITSASASLTVQVPPTITAEPQNLTRTAGQSASFSVTATGTSPLSYQWRFNGADITGGTSRTLSLAAISPSNEGTYSVIVTNVAGNIPSAGASLIVLVKPTITTQPVAATVTVNDTAIFTVNAAGTAPLTYQWRRNNVPLAGETSSILTLSSIQTAQAGSYSVVVTNAAGSITSASASLTVQVPPTITAEPQNLTRTAGQSASFSVTATGTSPLSYQWRFNGANIVGATSRTLSLAGISPANEGTYSVVVTNAAGNIASADAFLTVLVKPTITTQPLAAATTVNGAATFTVSAAGTAPLSYQWRRNNVALAGQTSSSLVLSNVQASQAGNYSVVVTNAAGTVTSANANLVVH